MGEYGTFPVIPDTMSRADYPPQAAMQFNDPPTTRPLMHTVDILGDHDDIRMLLFQPGQGRMTGVGRTIQYRTPATYMEGQNPLGITVKGILTGEILPPVFMPDTTASTISGNSAFRGHPRTGKDHDSVRSAPGDREIPVPVILPCTSHGHSLQ